jgi:hypothetical protein
MQGSLTSHLPYFHKTLILGLCLRHKCDFHKYMYANIYSHVDQLGVYYILRQSAQQWNKWPNDHKHFFQAQLVQISVGIFLYFTKFKSSYDVKFKEVLSSLFDMLLVTRKGSETWCYPCGSPSWVVHLFSRTLVLPFCFLFSRFFGCFSQFMAWFHRLGSPDRRFPVLEPPLELNWRINLFSKWN